MLTETSPTHPKYRRTARGVKLELLREKFGANPNFEVVEIRDIATDDFTGALEGRALCLLSRRDQHTHFVYLGVSAVVHLASPLAGRQSPEDALKVSPYTPRNADIEG